MCCLNQKVSTALLMCSCGSSSYIDGLQRDFQFIGHRRLQLVFMYFLSMATHT